MEGHGYQTTRHHASCIKSRALWLFIYIAVNYVDEPLGSRCYEHLRHARINGIGNPCHPGLFEHWTGPTDRHRVCSASTGCDTTRFLPSHLCSSTSQNIPHDRYEHTLVLPPHAPRLHLRSPGRFSASLDLTYPETNNPVSMQLVCRAALLMLSLHMFSRDPCERSRAQRSELDNLRGRNLLYLRHLTCCPSSGPSWTVVFRVHHHYTLIISTVTCTYRMRDLRPRRSEKV